MCSSQYLYTGIDPSLTREDINEINLQIFRDEGWNIVNSGPIDIAGGNIQGFFIEYEDYERGTKGYGGVGS